MSHLLNSVNNVKSSSDGNINLGLSSLMSSPSDTDVVGIDGGGSSKKLAIGTNVGDLAMSYVVQSAGWAGSGTITEGYNTYLRGSSCTVEENTSIITRHAAGGASWLQGWTLVAGNYLMLASWGFSLSSGGNCNVQFYNATTAAYVGPKMHFITGNFSNRLIYHANISSSTRFELRARDVVNNVNLFDASSMFACTIQIFKV
jgi:hypothetical protein